MEQRVHPRLRLTVRKGLSEKVTPKRRPACREGPPGPVWRENTAEAEKQLVQGS